MKPTTEGHSLARYRWRVVSAGPLLLDAGGMFGLIPRPVWSRLVEIDDRGRVALTHNCLWLEGVEGTPSAGRVMVIETGSGDKLDSKSVEIFGIGTPLHGNLAASNLDPSRVTDVIVSHLHFDHAGGLTRLTRDGEKPDWTGPGSNTRPHSVSLTFPSARVHVQRREWEDATNQTSVMTRTYFADNFEPIRDRLVLHDSPRPFPTGYIAHRDEMPLLTLEQRMTPVAPGLFVFLTPGHTWGQQAVLFHGERGEPVVFVPDVMPTAWHVGKAFSLAYDVEPYTSMISRQWFLHEACAREWTLVLDHDPVNPIRRAKSDGKGWFVVEGIAG